MSAIVPVTDQLFTAANIAGFGVATGAVTVAANALYKLAKLPQKWTAFVAAMAIAYTVVIISNSHEWYQWVLAFFNTCLLYCSALGANEVGTVATSPSGKGFAHTEGFFTAWFGKPRTATGGDAETRVA